MSYKTVKLSEETAFDLVRALEMAAIENDREGLSPLDPIQRQHEAMSRMVRDYSLAVIHSASRAPHFLVLATADWRCSRCGSSGLGRGGLRVVEGAAVCWGC